MVGEEGERGQKVPKSDFLPSWWTPLVQKAVYCLCSYEGWGPLNAYLGIKLVKESISPTQFSLSS